MSQKAPQIGDSAAQPKAYPRRAECVVELMRFELTTSAVRWKAFGVDRLRGMRRFDCCTRQAVACGLGHRNRTF
jgi:hypothetical protein